MRCTAMSCAAVIYLPRRSESIFHHPLLTKAPERSLLAWYADLFLTTHPGLPLWLLCHAESSALTDDLPAGMRVLSTDSPCEQDAWIEALPAFEHQHLAVVNPALGFAPQDLLSHVLQHHHEARNDYTYVTGFPAGAVPEIFS